MYATFAANSVRCRAVVRANLKLRLCQAVRVDGVHPPCGAAAHQVALTRQWGGQNLCHLLDFKLERVGVGLWCSLALIDSTS